MELKWHGGHCMTWFTLWTLVPTKVEMHQREVKTCELTLDNLQRIVITKQC